jgi:hypothetical protein
VTRIRFVSAVPGVSVSGIGRHAGWRASGDEYSQGFRVVCSGSRVRRGSGVIGPKRLNESSKLQAFENDQRGNAKALRANPGVDERSSLKAAAGEAGREELQKAPEAVNPPQGSK